MGKYVFLPSLIIIRYKRMQFLGNIEAKTDAKGRVFIPVTFRKQLQAVSEERLVLRKDVHQDCLVLYPESVWFATQNQLRRKLNKWDAKEQMIFRQFVSDAEVVSPDGNGRILLPKRYLQIAGIRNDVRFIGMDDTIEIWAKERADQPFMTSEAFSKGLEELLGRPCVDRNEDVDPSAPGNDLPNA